MQQPSTMLLFDECFFYISQEFCGFCCLYPSAVVGVITAVIVIPTYKGKCVQHSVAMMRNMSQ